MATVTLETMRRIVRELACQESVTPASAFVERNPELDGRINEHLCALRDLLIELQGQEWAVKTKAITLVSGTADYNLPGDFDELLGVRLERSGEQTALDPWDYADLAELESTGSYAEPSAYRYRLRDDEGGRITIKPTPDAADTLHLDYIPAYQELPNDAGAESFSMPYGAWKWAAYGAAVDALNKEDNHAGAQALMAQQAKLEQRLRRKFARRDRRAPAIRDTRRDKVRVLRRGYPRLWSST